MKPTIEEVVRYAKPQIMKFIARFAGDLPSEQKEEIEQSAYVRLIEAYPELDPEAGWKSFVFNHCRGAVLDYLKFGKGFQEDKWSIMKPEEHGSRHVNKIRDRVTLENQDHDDIDIDQVLGTHGIFRELDSDSPKIRWDLLSRLASRDEALLCFLKWLRGFDLEETGEIQSLSRSRVGQLIEDFKARFKIQKERSHLDPERDFGPWNSQILWALGLAEEFGLDDCDQSEVFGFSIGWLRSPVDIDSASLKFPNMQMDLLNYCHNQIETEMDRQMFEAVDAAILQEMNAKT